MTPAQHRVMRQRVACPTGGWAPFPRERRSVEVLVRLGLLEPRGVDEDGEALVGDTAAGMAWREADEWAAERTDCHPGYLGGTRRFVGTRIPVGMIGHWAREDGVDAVADSYPGIALDDIEMAWRWVASGGDD